MSNAATTRTIAAIANTPAAVMAAIVKETFVTIAPDFGATPELMERRYMAGSAGIVNLVNKAALAAWVLLQAKAA